MIQPWIVPKIHILVKHGYALPQQHHLQNALPIRHTPDFQADPMRQKLRADDLHGHRRLLLRQHEQTAALKIRRAQALALFVQKPLSNINAAFQCPGLRRFQRLVILDGRFCA